MRRFFIIFLRHVSCFSFHMQPKKQNTYQPFLDLERTYIPRGQNVLQQIFKEHFEDFHDQCSTQLNPNCRFNKVV